MHGLNSEGLCIQHVMAFSPICQSGVNFSEGPWTENDRCCLVNCSWECNSEQIFNLHLSYPDIGNALAIGIKKLVVWYQNCSVQGEGCVLELIYNASCTPIGEWVWLGIIKMISPPVQSTSPVIVYGLYCIECLPTLENATTLSALLWFPVNCFAHTATTAPTVVTSAAATGSQATSAPSLAETCRALDTLRNNAQSLNCNRNDQCDIVYCTVTDSTVRGFVTAANLTLLPCNQPPAVRVTATNPSGGVVLDRVISRSETFSLPQGTTLRVTLNQLTNAIGFGVSRHNMVIASCCKYGSWLYIAAKST